MLNQNTNSTDEEKKRQRHALEMEIIMLESDMRKDLAENNALDAEIRKLRMDAERMRIAMDEKKKRFDKISFDLTQGEAEVKRLKKKINLLT